MLIHTTPDLSKLPGGWVPDSSLIPTLTSKGDAIIRNRLPMNPNGIAIVLKDVLNREDTTALKVLFDKAPTKAPVSVTGFMDGQEHAAMGGVAGSVRATMWSPELTTQIWKRIAFEFGQREFNSRTSTDWWQHGEHVRWQAVGMSPMMRFMRYDQGGEHYAHYDAAYFYPDGEHRTLMSVVIYLTTNSSGATRLIKDEQYNTPIQMRKFDDWTRQVKEEEILHKVLPMEGSVFIFDHRLVHDVEPYVGTGPRIIIRTDIIFKKV